ncbi:MAG: hypothetical protein IZT59_08175 [Verrucomicrobia bacterium]|nr:hypothetical protein [Verrucomicrobiota bacterium]
MVRSGDNDGRHRNDCQTSSIPFYIAFFHHGGYPPRAEHGSKTNIAYRHGGKAIVVFHDGHASPVSSSEIPGKAATDAFWVA